MPATTIIVYIIILFLSVIIHELAHGYMAEWLGDPTARIMGRLTLNPLKHIDIVGSILVPLLLVITKSPVLLGWAKPVPFNPLNFQKHRKWGGALVAVAGPLSNIILAAIFSIIVRLAPATSLSGSPFVAVSAMIVLLNISLAVFNLIPVTPLDGHHILYAFIPSQYTWVKSLLTRYSIVVFLLIFFVFWGPIQNLMIFLFHVMAGPDALTLLAEML